jgi:membrane-bound lytic murein transglycosylase MltF
LGTPWTGDLDGILERGEIRVLTTYTLGTYYVDGGRPRGITVETVELFEAFLKKQLGEAAQRLRVVIIPVRRDKLLPYLVEGYGDLASATLRITPKRREVVDFSVPFTSDDDEYVIKGPRSPEVTTLSDLSGKEVFVREDSSYFESLAALNREFKEKGLEEIRISAADPRLETEDLIEMVNAGLLPLTVADDFRTRLWSRVFPDIQTSDELIINRGGEIAVALRKESPELKRLVDAFVSEHRLGTKKIDAIVSRYRDKADWVKAALSREPFGRLKETEGLFKKYGELYGFDWLLLASFAYQESGLKQDARSSAGAVGIMQILPSTAADKNVGVPNIELLENNIHAGTKYLSVLRNLYFADLEADDFERSLFTMAGYNAGPNRINRLRAKAEERGLNPNVWFNNLELVVAASVGQEPVKYVRNIYKYYVAYKRVLTEADERAAAKSRPN